MDVTIDQIKLGEDYTDIKADLKFLTHKTDIIDSVFMDYITEFASLGNTAGMIGAASLI